MKKKDSQNSIHFSHDTLMRYAKILGFGQIHTKIDSELGLHAIIAIHNTDLGPAIGGTRFIHYPSTSLALYDALRLAYHMTLKAAISDLAHGGAKAVLVKPKDLKNRRAYLRSYGDFVHQMDGQYITAVDVGTNEEDMDIIAERTPYVFGASRVYAQQKDPSLFTAQGVLRGIQAAVKFKLKRDDLEGLHVAVQGAGHVGYLLAKLLTQRGAKITIADPKPELTQHCAVKFNARIVQLDEIYDVPCDIFSPCALGGIINLDTIRRLKASIIAGSANTQLAHHKYDYLLRDKGILYVPDFVINSGGLIYAAMVYDYQDPNMAISKIDQLYSTLLDIFARSEQTNVPTHTVAVQMSEEKLKKKKILKKVSL